MYLFDPSAFRRITLISLICCTVIVLIVRTEAAARLLIEVGTAFTLCWYVIHRSTKKVDPDRSTIVTKSETRDS